MQGARMRRSVAMVVAALLLLGGALGGVLAQASGARPLTGAAGHEPQRGKLLDANIRTPARGHAKVNPAGPITSPNWPAGRPVGHVANAYPAIAARNAARASEVLRVGSFHGIPGQFRTIQAALDAARPGDVILIGPGDYKTTSVRFPTGAGGDFPAADLVTTPNLTIRGMNRNRVIVDDTTAGPPCNNITADQDFGPATPTGPAGLNGLMVYKAANVSIENLTACNFPGGSGADADTGNGIWWNGGANSKKIGGWGYYGAYLTGTTLYYANETSAAQYGIFSSNWDGGMWDHVYASNMNDSGLYIGACQQQCNQVVDDAWAEFSALGYSGTNSGGNLVIENSQWDNNEDGFDTNSQNADEPSPQNGACPNNGISPITHTHSCWVFMDNWSHDNNNATAPAAGSAAAGPVGTGMTLSGGRNDTVMDNYFENNDAWGNAFVPYPDSGPPCTGGTGGTAPGVLCVFDEYGDALIGNYYKHNGSFHNPTNGDFGFANFEPDEPTDCFADNTDADGKWTSAPSGLESQFPTCNGKKVLAPEVSNPQGLLFTAEVACDSGIGLAAGQSLPCPPGSHYPKVTTPVIHPLPAASELVTMPNPCGGVPANPWCRDSVTRIRRCVRAGVTFALSTATGERITAVRVTANGRRVRSRRRGARLIRVALASRRGRVEIRVLEKMIVDHHRESVRFTRIYHVC
jgi:hypothetical protein